MAHRYGAAVTPPVPAHISSRIDRVHDLSQWERAELGRRLREHGWTYREIGAVVGAAKSTIAGWCRNIELTAEQIEDIKARTGSQQGIPRDTQWRRRRELEAVQASARESYEQYRSSPLWCLGTALYWGEGSKSKKMLSVTNSDPGIHRRFLEWVETFLVNDPEVVLHLHLHEGNNQEKAREWWQHELSLPEVRFDKSFVKPAGTGQRKNTLAHGVARTRICRSTDAWHTAMTWIECLRIDEAIGVTGILPPGR